MSVRVMSWVFEHSKSTGNDRLVLLAIADRCDDDGGNCWKSTEKLADKARVSKRTAQRCIDHLIELGELRSVARLGMTSVLSVVMEGRQVDAGTPATAPRKGGVKLSPVSDRRRDNSDARGASTVTPDTSLIHPSTPQPPASGGRDSCASHKHHRKTCPDCIAARAASKAKPPWCGECDERTRLIENIDRGTAHRCPDCHPLSEANDRAVS